MFGSLSEKLSHIFSKIRNRGKLTDLEIKNAMREIKIALLEADVNFGVVKDLVAKISEKASGERVMKSLTPGQQVVKIVNEELTALMGSTNSKLQVAPKLPSVILMCGLQGAGKTTMCGKLAKYLKKQGKKPMLVACDIYRPAAINQLKVVGKSVEVEVYDEGTNKPVKTATNAIKYADKKGYDTVIIDTAGRLHIDSELMQELKDIKKATNPIEILLTVDSMTGQDAVNVATSFNEQLDITGVILTKLDGDTRGGAALSIKAVTNKPIKFCGIGEKMDDLEPFHPDRMASRILDMGDVLSLIETDAEITFTDDEGNFLMDGSVLKETDGAILSYEDGVPIVLLNIADPTLFGEKTGSIAGHNMIAWIGYQGPNDEGYIGDFAAYMGQGTEEQQLLASKKIIVNATVNEAISSDTAKITGSFTAEEASKIGKLLSAGNMNFELSRTDVLKVDGAYGESAFNKSIIAGVVGLIAGCLIVSFF